MAKYEPQDRCVEVFTDIGEHECLSTADIKARHFGDCSIQRCRERLGQAEGAGYLRSVRLNSWYTDDNRNAVKAGRVYFITEKAAGLVAKRTGMYPKRVLRGDVPASDTVLHRLRGVHFRMRLDPAAPLHGLDTLWTLEHDQREPANLDLPPNQRKVLYYRFQSTDGRIFTCQPDIAVLLTRRDKPTQLGLLIEIDMGSSGRKQLKNKLPGYEALLQQQAYHSLWPNLPSSRIRILWVFCGRKRRDSALTKLRHSPVSSQCRFGVFSQLLPDVLLSGDVWLNHDREAVSIIRQPR